MKKLILMAIMAFVVQLTFAQGNASSDKAKTKSTDKVVETNEVVTTTTEEAKEMLPKGKTCGTKGAKGSKAKCCKGKGSKAKCCKSKKACAKKA